MEDYTVPPPPKPKEATAVLRSDLERRLRKAAKKKPHIFYGVLSHAVFRGGYYRESLSSTTEFLDKLKADVGRIEIQLRDALPNLLFDRFQYLYRFGEAYRRMWKERQEEAMDCPLPLKEWAEDEANGQSGMRDDERTMVYFHVGADLAEPQTLTLRARTYMEVFIVGNVMLHLVAKGLDPANASLWVRLPNSALMNINWYDTLPIPAPPFERSIHLELHRPAWRAPAVTLSRRATGRTLLCAIFNQFSDEPRFFHLPILEGGWLELSQARRFLRKRGVEKDGASIILRGSTVNPSCQLEMTWDDLIPVPPATEFALVLRFVCRKCLLMEPLRTLRAEDHFCTKL